MIFVKILVLIVGLTLGIGLVKYNYQLTQLFGYNSLAERYLGPAGTYAMWRILGVIIIAGVIIYVFR